METMKAPELDKEPKLEIWSSSRLMGAIETFGYQMAEMGRQNGFAAGYRNDGNTPMALMHEKRAEMYRESAKTALADINAQLTLKGM